MSIGNHKGHILKERYMSNFAKHKSNNIEYAQQVGWKGSIYDYMYMYGDSTLEIYQVWKRAILIQSTICAYTYRIICMIVVLFFGVFFFFQ